MALNFPNASRSYDSTRHAVRFWGYDSTMETSFFVGREKIIAGKDSQLSRWQRWLFSFMSNNMLNATEFFRIPSNRVVELGGQLEI